MTPENKELLLEDLSARLPYGVFCVGTTYELDDDGERYIPIKEKDILTEIHNYKIETASVRLGLLSSCKLETVKPYLRPLSSMTEEEAKELSILCDIKDIISIKITDEYIDFVVDDDFCSTGTMTIWYDEIISSIEIFDWLNKNHFDFRGLIPKNLAIEVTKENNPYKD